MNRVRVRAIKRKVMVGIGTEEVAEDTTEIALGEPREITDKIESAAGTMTNTTLDFRGATPRRKTNQPRTVRCPSRRPI